MIGNFLKKFLKQEAAGGIILLVVTLLALVCANSFLRDTYQHFLHIELGFNWGFLDLKKSVSHWINDGLMVIFFLLVGLEIKREMCEGQLASRQQMLLPLFAALGGMLVPALIFMTFNHDHDYAMKGWAIPSATDIAFAIGVLSLLGKRVPTGLKVFLTALAIIDDLGAIVIIALFYSSNLSLSMLVCAAIVFAALCILNKRGITTLRIYLSLGMLLWFFILTSGIHATIAGVLLAFTIPLKAKANRSPLKSLEHALHPWVTFGVMPIFAFANAGLDVSNISLASLGESVPLGIICGLFFGKQLGVFGAAWLAIKSGIGRLPEGSSWAQLYGMAIVAGIGFTMSLFIGSLAYKDEHIVQLTQLGVLTGSLLSAVYGLIFLLSVTKTAKSFDR